MRLIVIFLLIMIFAGSICRAEGLRSLIDVAKSQADIQKEYARETKQFDKVKSDIESSLISKGQSKDEVLKRYGEPIVRISENGREKWVYKPASSTYFEGVKAYLFFDATNKIGDMRIEGNIEEKK